MDEYGKMVPEEKRGGMGEDGLTVLLCLNPTEHLLNDHKIQLEEFRRRYDNDPTFRNVINRAAELQGLYKSTGVHAAGVIIGTRPLHLDIPVLQDKKTGLLVSQYVMKEVEAAGLIKYDFLGLRTLDVIQDAVDSVYRRIGTKINWDEIDERDEDTYEMLCAGNTFGVFQLESSGMSAFCKEFQPYSIDDISTISALYRPGPLDNGMTDEVVRVRNGGKPHHYDITPVNRILASSGHTMCYQEQVLQIAREVCGFSYADADILRRAIGKKDANAMLAERDKFVQGGERNGWKRKDLIELFEMIEKFAAYSFNKSHSVAYSVLSFRTAYLKAHYPADFYAAEMSSYDMKEKVAAVAQNARRNRIRVLPPDVNTSLSSFTATSSNVVRFGLSAVAGCGDSAVLDLIEAREKEGPFKNLIDLALRTKTVNRGNLVALAKAGALDALEPELNRAELIAYAGNVTEGIKVHKTHLKTRQTDMFGQLFDDGMGLMIHKPKIPTTEEEMLDWELEAVSFYLSGHPLSRYIEAAGYDKFDDIGAIDEEGVRVTLLGFLKDVTIRAERKSGRLFAFFTVEDRSGEIKCKMWSRNYEKVRGQLEDGLIAYVHGTVDDYRGLELVVDNVIPASISPLKMVTLSSLHLELITKLSSLEFGDTAVDLKVHDRRYRLGHFACDRETFANLQEFVLDIN